MSRRIVRGAVLASGLLLAAGCFLSQASQSHNAVYPGGLSLGARAASGEYTSLQWQREHAGGPQPCPLTLHLPGGDLGPADLADAKLLRRRGWFEQYRDDARAMVAYQWEDVRNGAEVSLAQVMLVDGAIDRVLVRTTDALAVSVNGRRVPLPVAGAEMERLLGKPLRVEVYDAFNGRVR